MSGNDNPNDPVTHYDVSYLKVEDGGEKEHWVKIGRGFPSEGGRILVKLDALPLQFTTATKIVLFAKTKREGAGK